MQRDERPATAAQIDYARADFAADLRAKGRVGGLKMDIKARIDGLSEAEAKAALGWAIHKARIYGSCFECDLDGDCRKDYSVDCDMEYLRQALKGARG